MKSILPFIKFRGLRLFLASVGVPALAMSLPANEQIQRTQAALAQWLETEKLISAEERDWAVEKAVVENSIDFMQKEIERLERSIQEAEESASAGERKRQELETEAEQLTAVSDTVKDVIGRYEAAIIELSKTWPGAFVESIRRPLERIPEGEEADQAALTMRMQNVIVILSQFDKFNSIVTKDKEVQEIDGTSREVTTLYYGVAFAYFVDGSGAYAGYGFPSLSGEGWDWTMDASLASEINELVAVYDQTTEAVFVSLPAKISTP